MDRGGIPVIVLLGDTQFPAGKVDPATEIHDALRIATVDVLDGTASDTSLQTVAVALRGPAGDGPRVADLLERVDSREADVRQVLPWPVRSERPRHEGES